MIKLFEIKNKKVDKQDTELLEKYKKILSQSKEQVIKQFSTSYQFKSFISLPITSAQV